MLKKFSNKLLHQISWKSSKTWSRYFFYFKKNT